MALKPLVRRWLQSVFILPLLSLLSGYRLPLSTATKPTRISLPIIRAFYWSYHLPLCYETNFYCFIANELEAWKITEFARNAMVSNEGARVNQHWMSQLEQVSLSFVNGFILT